MSAFPRDLVAAEGEQYNTYTDERYPLGTELVLKNGRKYVFAKNGAAAAAPGKLFQMAAPGAGDDELAVAAAVAIGAKTVILTVASLTLNQWAEGYLSVEDDAGEGYAYRIRENSASATGAVTHTFSDGTPVVLANGQAVFQIETGFKVALTTSSTVLIVLPAYKSVVIHPSPPTSSLAGVAATTIAASSYGWFQTRGYAAVLGSGTLVAGDLVVPGATVDGSVMPSAALETDGPPVGFVVEVAADTEYSLVDLRL